MARHTGFIRGLVAALLLLIPAQRALAIPIEVAFRADDGSAYGQFAFEPLQPQDNPGSLTSGYLGVAGRLLLHSQMYYEYFPIQDSLSVRIIGNEASGLDPGDSFRLTFSGHDEPTLDLPTHATLTYSLGGVSGQIRGMVSVPEPLAAGITGLAAGALAWRRRRNRPAGR